MTKVCIGHLLLTNVIIYKAFPGMILTASMDFK